MGNPKPTVDQATEDALLRASNEASWNEYPSNPDDWMPTDGVTGETKTRENTDGAHRQWKDSDGNIVRRWDKGEEGKSGWRGQDHWHDENGNHIPPNR